MNKTLFLALGVISASAAMAQTINVPGTVNFDGPIGDPGNTTLSGLAPVGAPYTLGAGVTLGGGVITSGGVGSWQNEASVRMENSAFPGLSATFNFSPATGTFTSFTVVSGTSRLFGSNSIGAVTIPSGSTWTLEFWDSFPDPGVDQTGSGLIITPDGLPAVGYTFTNAGAIQSLANGPFDPVNPSVTGPAVGAGFNLGAAAISSATYQQTVANDWPSDTVVVIRNSARPSDWAFARPMPFNGSVASTTFVNSVVAVGGPMVGKSIVAGSTMSFTYSNNPTDGIAAGEEAQISNINFRLTQAGAAPLAPMATDLGLVSTSSSPVTGLAGLLSASQVKWFRFELGGNVDVASSTFFNAYTTSTDSLDDTEIALYNEFGYFVTSDDEDDAGSLSALTFGADSSPANGDGLPFDGRDASSLPSGVYYMAVCTWNALFFNGFEIEAGGPATGGDINLLLRSNVAGAANAFVNGTVSLNDTQNPLAQSRFVSFAIKQGSTTLFSGMAAPSTPSQSFSFPVPASATGPATLEFDGSPYLRRVVNINLTGSNVAVGTVNVQNGDVDNSGEVDAADIDQVIADFGSGANISSDVDASGEVDAADIDIVIANFGGTDN